MPAKGNDGRYLPLIAAMRTKVQYAIDRNIRIVYLDEVVFTKKTCKATEWSAANDNIFVPCESLKVPYTAVIAAISYDMGVVHYEMLDEAANHENFASFLENLFPKFEEPRLSLVLDNLAVHFHEDVKKVYTKHNVYYIRNAPYHPQFNPIVSDPS